MPPKRKRAGEEAASVDTALPPTRSTRSSTKTKNIVVDDAPDGHTETQTTLSKPKGHKAKAAAEPGEVPPPAKKAKSTKIVKSIAAEAVKTTEAVPSTDIAVKAKPSAARGKTKTDSANTIPSGTSPSTVTATASTSKVNEDQLPLPPAPASANKNAKSIPVAETPAARAPTVAQTSSTIPPTPVTASAQTATTKRSTPKASTTVKSGANAVIPYTPARSVAIFDEYADEDEPDAIGPEGLERLCDDMGVPMDGPGPFVLAWLLGAKEMGKIAKAEWVKGTDDLQIASVSALKMVLEEFQDLLMTDKPPVQASAPVAQPAKGKRVSTKTGSSEQYNRTRYLQAAADRRGTFAQLYNFCFTMAKPEQSRNLDMDFATAFWSVLLAPRYPIAAEILDFVGENGSYRAVNKDLWSMTLEFCETVNPNLDNFEADGAWPTMIDEFVEWKRAKASA